MKIKLNTPPGIPQNVKLSDFELFSLNVFVLILLKKVCNIHT